MAVVGGNWFAGGGGATAGYNNPGVAGAAGDAGGGGKGAHGWSIMTGGSSPNSVAGGS